MDPLPEPTGRPSRPGGPALDDHTVAEARRGDRAAMRRVYDVLAPTVAGYARGHGVEDPEALANETLYRVLDRLPAFAGTSDQFRSWAFTIAHNLIVDDRRRMSRRPIPAEAVDEHHLPVVSSAEDEALRHLGTSDMVRWIRELPDGQRDVLLLRLVADLPVREVGRIVGRREGAVKALHRRGLDALRRRHDARTVSESDPTTFTEV